MRTEYKIYSIHYACVSMCLYIHVFVWVLGVWVSVSVSMKNFVIKISDVRGGGGDGGFGRHSDNPGQTGEGGGLKITILAGRPL